MTPAQKKAALRAVEAMNDLDLEVLVIDSATPPEVMDLALEEIARRDDKRGRPFNHSAESWAQVVAREEQHRRDMEADYEARCRKYGRPPLPPR